MPSRHAAIAHLTWWIAALALLGTAQIGCDRVFQLDKLADDRMDAGDNADDGATADASTTACLSDDFSTDVLDESKWTIEDAAPVATVAQTGGQLVFSLGQASGVNYAQVTTQPRDMTNDALSVEVITSINSATDAELGISLQSDYQHRYQLFITGTSLLMRYSTPAGNSDTYTQYSTTHRFLRLRHAGDTMFWETSSDRDQWVVRRMAGAVVDVTNVQARIFAGTYQLEPAAPGQPVVDNALIECLP